MTAKDISCSICRILAKWAANTTGGSLQSCIFFALSGFPNLLWLGFYHLPLQLEVVAAVVDVAMNPYTIFRFTNVPHSRKKNSVDITFGNVNNSVKWPEPYILLYCHDLHVGFKLILSYFSNGYKTLPQLTFQVLAFYQNLDGGISAAI